MSWESYLMSQPLDMRDRNTVKPVRPVAIAPASTKPILKKREVAQNGK